MEEASRTLEKTNSMRRNDSWETRGPNACGELRLQNFEQGRSQLWTRQLDRRKIRRVMKAHTEPRRPVFRYDEARQSGALGNNRLQKATNNLGRERSSNLGCEWLSHLGYERTSNPHRYG